MNTTIIFLSYVFAGFVGFSAVALVILLIKHKAMKKTQVMKSLCGFLISSFLLGILYFVTDCLDTLYGGHPYNSAIRLIDMWLFIVMGYFWFRTIKTGGGEEKYVLDGPAKAVLAGVIILLAVSIPEYVVFMDSYYYVDPGWERYYSYAVETAMCFFFIVVDVIFLVRAFKKLKNRELKIYLIIVTAAAMANNIWNGLATLWVINGKLTIATWNSQVYDPTAMLLLVINLVTLIFVFIYDFSPIYFRRESANKRKLTDEDKVEIVAEKFGLTNREKEVSILAFEGYTYDEMADELCISKYTVKRHIHNIYEKLEISNRMELVDQVGSVEEE